MDIEFHYYMTYLITKKAGFGNDEAGIIAHSSQYTDDNDIIFEVSKDTAEYYRNYISQTMNILKPKAKLFRIYPLFHFIPGDPMYDGALRKDGRLHFLNTTPNNDNASKILDAALKSGNLYRIGIASHSYVDTWAHQNFIGHFDPFNAMGSVFENPIPNIGHADAQHNPDWPGLVWQDNRLLGSRERANNKSRFLEAAKHLFIKYRKYLDSVCEEGVIQGHAEELTKDLDRAIGGRDQNNTKCKSRIEKYKKLGQKVVYGKNRVPEYDPDIWFEEAMNEDVRGIRDRSDIFLTRWDPLTDIYTWRNPDGYQDTHWYKFQEAVKEHQDEAWNITKDNTFSKLDLEDLKVE